MEALTILALLIFYALIMWIFEGIDNLITAKPDMVNTVVRSTIGHPVHFAVDRAIPEETLFRLPREAIEDMKSDVLRGMRAELMDGMQQYFNLSEEKPPWFHGSQYRMEAWILDMRG